MKKWLVIIISICGILLLVTVGLIYHHEANVYNELDSYIRWINKEITPDIIVYGEQYELREGIAFRRIDNIDENSILSIKQEYHGLIIFDFDGNVQLSDEELLTIKRLCDEGKLDLYYYGTDKLDDLLRLGFMKQIDEEDCGVMYIGTDLRDPLEEGREGYIIHGLYNGGTGKKREDSIRLQITLLEQMYINACNATGISGT